MRNVITLLALLCCLPLLGETVSMRLFDVELQPEQAVSQRLDAPAWSGRTRLVCARSLAPWCLKLITSSADTISVDFTWGNTFENSFEPVPQITSTLLFAGQSYSGSLSERKGVTITKNDYLITVSWSIAQGVSVACCNLLLINDIPLKAPVTSLLLESAEELPFTEWLTDTETISELRGSFTEEEIRAAVASSTDSISGYYRYFDRDTDPKYANPGGSYTLEVIPIPNTSDYAICYIEGASVNSSLWQPGMVKGILSPTDFESHFNLRWLDAAFHEIYAEQYAQFQENNLLRLHFPIYNSSLRFERIK